MLRQGRAEAALTEFRRSSRLVKEYPRMRGRQRVFARTLAGLSAAHAAAGDNSRARQLLGEAVELVDEAARSPHTWLWEGLLGQLYYCVAAAYAPAGQNDHALENLGQAVKSGWRDPRWFSSDPALAGLRSTQRYEELSATI